MTPAGWGTWDSSLLVFLANLWQRAAAHDVAFDASGLPEPAQRLLALLPQADTASAPTRKRPVWVARLGLATTGLFAELTEIAALVGESALRAAAALAGRARMRPTDLLSAMRCRHRRTAHSPGRG